MYTLFFDETANTKQDLAGYGCLFIDESTADKVIKEAMKDLKKDPDKNAQDEITLERGYFHACEDSKNAHSHICTNINKYVKGYFTSFLHKNSESTLELEELYSLAKDSIGLNLFYIRNEISVSFEGRNKDSEKKFIDWYEDLKNKIFPNLYENPYIETCFPPISFVIHDKHSTAGQICDFILWAALRHYDKNDPIWWDRLNGILHMKMASNGKGEPTNLISYDLDFDITDLPSTYNYENVKITENLHDSFQLANLYLEWEQQINKIILCIPKTLIHFEDELKNFQKNKFKNSNRIVDGAKLFLKIIDTGEYFYGESQEHIEHLLFMKKWMAFLTIPDNPMTEATLDYMNKLFTANSI